MVAGVVVIGRRTEPTLRPWQLKSVAAKAVQDQISIAVSQVGCGLKVLDFQHHTRQLTAASLPEAMQIFVVWIFCLQTALSSPQQQVCNAGASTDPSKRDGVGSGEAGEEAGLICSILAEQRFFSATPQGEAVFQKCRKGSRVLLKDVDWLPE